MGSDRQAKSFPCGHCAIGFYVSAPWLVLRRRRPRLALGFLLGGLGWGLTMGAARMMAGGHFFSDVVWAGGMVWLVALALYPLLRPDEAPAPYVPEDAARRKGQRRLATALGGLALAALTTAALVATPYLSEKSWRRSAAEVAQSPAPRFAVVLDQATVSLEAGADFEAGYAIQAFGFPTSRVGFASRRLGPVGGVETGEEVRAGLGRRRHAADVLGGGANGRVLRGEARLSQDALREGGPSSWPRTNP